VRYSRKLHALKGSQIEEKKESAFGGSGSKMSNESQFEWMIHGTDSLANWGLDVEKELPVSQGSAKHALAEAYGFGGPWG
jgi:hypothetical protein